MHRPADMVNPPWREPRLLIITAYAAARGVTARGATGYLLAWLAVATASRASISALGLQFAPPGSAALDTVAVILLLLPAGILASCLHSQTPSLEATRARPRQPAQSLWVGALAALAVLTPMAAIPLLHPSIDPSAFLATWCTTLGIWLIIGVLGSSILAATGTFTVLAAFSTPSLVPWHANIIYNVDAGTAAAGTAAVTFLAGVALQALSKNRRSNTS